ncbi:MAG: low-specificity L-threonine aldolase [Acidimicrobiaceae bacterium]|nr:low-specificity L-threonine aldolase [Acidimicrobiaceae bacterium]
MIDLRSDTVTEPTAAMRAAMAEAAVGDDVYGEDPTVNRLQSAVAELLGKEAALFVTSGTQSNLCALLSHCGRGDEYIVGDHAHCYMYEAGGGAVLGSIQPQPVPTGEDGMLDLEAASGAVKRRDHHFARTRLLCLENTIDGKVLCLEQMRASAEVAARHGLAHHLDGARMWNAAVALGAPPAEVASHFDSVSVCLSKGLGAPMGSLLTGSTDLIDEAHKWRKMLGGGLRQAGLVAAAGLYALEHHIERLADDHAKAARLAEGLAETDGVTVESCSTNMVFIRLEDALLHPQQDLRSALLERGVVSDWHGSRCRLVTHLNVSDADIDTAVSAFSDLIGAQ